MRFISLSLSLSLCPCVYGCMHVCVFLHRAHIHGSLHHVHRCVCVSLSVCVYVRTSMRVFTRSSNARSVCVTLYDCAHVYVYTCVCVYTELKDRVLYMIFVCSIYSFVYVCEYVYVCIRVCVCLHRTQGQGSLHDISVLDLLVRVCV